MYSGHICQIPQTQCHKYYRSIKHTWKDVVIAMGSSTAGQNPAEAEIIAGGIIILLLYIVCVTFQTT